SITVLGHCVLVPVGERLGCPGEANGCPGEANGCPGEANGCRGEAKGSLRRARVRPTSRRCAGSKLRSRASGTASSHHWSPWPCGEGYGGSAPVIRRRESSVGGTVMPVVPKAPATARRI